MTPRAQWRSYLRFGPRFVRVAAVVIATVVPLLVTLDRFRVPFGEKYMFPHRGGSADLRLPYVGARAILAGVDPYAPGLAQRFRDPDWPQTYPPTMLLLYAPLVKVSGDSLEVAQQVFYVLNIGALLLLAFVTWDLMGRARLPGSLPIFLFCFGLCPAGMFAVDRGQSELINAALCWTAIWLFVRRRFAVAMALVVLAAAIKGYAGVLALALLVSVPREARKRAFLASLGVAAAVVLPVATLVVPGVTAMLVRAQGFFAASWFNHSFKNVAFWMGESESEIARLGLLALSGVVVALAGWRLFRTLRPVGPHAASEDTLRCRAVLLATAALAFMVGMPRFSGPYNFLLVLPGLLILASTFDVFARATRLNPRLSELLGPCTLLALACALTGRIGTYQVPLAGVALVYVVGLVGILSLSAAKGTLARP